MHACDGTMTVFPQALTALNRRWDLVAERRGHRGVRYGVEGPAQRVHAASLRETLGDALAARCFLFLRFFLRFLLSHLRRHLYLCLMILCLLEVSFCDDCGRLDKFFLCLRFRCDVIYGRSVDRSFFPLHNWRRFLWVPLRGTNSDSRGRICQSFLGLLSYVRFGHAHALEHSFDLRAGDFRFAISVRSK